MNGIHDLGAMHGFGTIHAEPDEPVFHEAWEARMFGLNLAKTSPPGFSADRFRFLRECMPPVTYLAWSYYEHWYFVTALSLLRANMISLDELLAGHASPDRRKRDDAMGADKVASAFKAGGRFDREIASAPVFSIGQAVKARNLNPSGHTRLPRYARGKRGLVRHWHGPHVLPDLNARGDGERPEHLYSVMFTARELWGEEAAETDKVFLDLWESYLDAA
jgi:nitrile hydratase subunit beta